MSKQDLVGCHIKIKNLAGADPHQFMFNVGDVLEVVEAKSIGSELNSIKFKFKDKPISWRAGPEYYEIVAHPKEWYKDKWIVFTHHVGYYFLENTPYQIKECNQIDSRAAAFVFHNSPSNTWIELSFHVEHNKYKIVDAPAKRESLLEEAKRRYPVGTRYKCAKDGQEGVSIEEVYYDNDDNICSKFEKDRFNQYVYVNGKWAEIITLMAGAVDPYSGTFTHSNGTTGTITLATNTTPIRIYDSDTVKQPSTAESKIQHIPDLNVSLRKASKNRHIKHS